MYQSGFQKQDTEIQSKKRRKVGVKSSIVPVKRKKEKTSYFTYKKSLKDAAAEEQRLENLVFGSSKNVLERLDGNTAASDKNQKEPLNTDIKKPGIKKSGIKKSGIKKSGIKKSRSLEAKYESGTKRHAAWEDEEDVKLSIPEALDIQKRHLKASSSGPYSHTLKEKFKATLGTPKWAKLGAKPKKSDSDSADSDDELLKHCGKFVTKKLHLNGGMVKFLHMNHLNDATQIEGYPINAVEFHRTATVGLVAGANGIASLFQVDGVKNQKLLSTEFKGFPIFSAHFSHDGEQFLVSSESRKMNFIFSYDMMVGKPVKIFTRGACRNGMEVSPDGRLIALLGFFGNIHLYTSYTKEYIDSLKMNGNVFSVAFSPDGSRLYSFGSCGEVYVWDMKTRTCIHRFADDGCLVGRSISVSPSNQLLACGQQSGIVNVYNTSDLMTTSTPKPLKILKNLTTVVTSVKFNPTSEILAMASGQQVGSIKLVHVPSMTVFSNFPQWNQKDTSKPMCLDFSPNSGYLALGSQYKTAKLYRLSHYENY